MSGLAGCCAAGSCAPSATSLPEATLRVTTATSGRRCCPRTPFRRLRRWDWRMRRRWPRRGGASGIRCWRWAAVASRPRCLRTSAGGRPRWSPCCAITTCCPRWREPAWRCDAAEGVAWLRGSGSSTVVEVPGWWCVPVAVNSPLTHCSDWQWHDHNTFSAAVLSPLSHHSESTPDIK